MPDLRLISTDFDGTLIAQPSDGKCIPELATEFIAWKESGAQWALNTGRSLEHAVEGLETFAAPVEPDFLLTLEREIHVRSANGGWTELADWNRRCRSLHAELFHRSSGLLDRLGEHFGAMDDVTLIEEGDELIGLVTTDESVMERVAREMAHLQKRHPKLNYQRNTIYLRFCHVDYDKGASLRELCRILELSPKQVFATGDHFNDLSMLDPEIAAYVACPANAVFPVKQRIASAGGFVSQSRAGKGVAEALHSLRASAKENRWP